MLLAVAAGAYAAWRFAAYGRDKALQLVQTGQTAAEQGKFTQALTDFEGALALRGVAAGSAAQAAAMAASIFASKDQPVDAQRYLKQAVELQAGDVSYAALYVRSLTTTRNLAEAAKVLAEAEKQSSDDAGLLVAATRLDLARQDDATAQSDAARAIKADGSNAEAVVLAALLQMHAAPADAAKALQQALSLTKDQGLLALAQSLRPIAQQIQTGLGNEAYEHVLVATALLDHGEFDAARLECIRATQIKDSYRDAWVCRGSAELGARELDAATTSLARAKALDPTHGFTRYQLGLLALVRRDHAAATKELSESITLGYDTVDVRLALAQAFILAGAHKEARIVYQQAVTDFAAEPRVREAWFWFEFVDASNAATAAKVAGGFAKDLPASALAEGLVALAAWSRGEQATARTQSEAALKKDPALAVGVLVQGLLDNDHALLTHAIDLDVEGHVSVQAQAALKS